MTARRVLGSLVVLELALLIAEPLLVRSLGQQAIAAAMLTAPTGGPALLGLAAVLARIGARALVPAAIALAVAALVARRLTARWSAPPARRT